MIPKDAETKIGKSKEKGIFSYYSEGATDLKLRKYGENFSTYSVVLHDNDTGDQNTYLEDSSIGSKETLFSRVKLKDRDTSKVITMYDFDKVEEKNYSKTEQHKYNKEYFRDEHDTFILKKDKQQVDATVRLNSRYGKRRYDVGSRDEVYTLHYETPEKGVVESGKDQLGWDSDKATVDKYSLIPFCITTITPERRTYLNFPAYLENYDDSYDAEWESVQYVGRADKFYGYRGFKRSISLSFMVIAKRREDLVPIYRKLNRLVGATAPSYDETGLFMRGTLASLSIGSTNGGYGATPANNGLLNNQLGIITNVKLSWDKDVPWETDPEHLRVPHALSVSISFTPIEKEEAREDFEGFFAFNGKDAKEGQKQEEEKQTPVEVPEDHQEYHKLTAAEGGGGKASISGGAGYSGGGSGGGSR